MMKGYVCTDCGHTFVYPRIIEENQGFDGFNGPSYWERYQVCPKCKSEDFEETEIEDTQANIELAEYERQREEDLAMYEYYMKRW